VPSPLFHFQATAAAVASASSISTSTCFSVSVPAAVAASNWTSISMDFKEDDGYESDCRFGQFDCSKVEWKASERKSSALHPLLPRH
ncbi:hypothetical protein LINPERHAP2_LOCUS35415, partial [Linum perenne]